MFENDMTSLEEIDGEFEVTEEETVVEEVEENVLVDSSINYENVLDPNLGEIPTLTPTPLK